MDCGYPLSEEQHLAPLTCNLDGLLTTSVSSGLQGSPRGDILWQTRSGKRDVPCIGPVRCIQSRDEAAGREGAILV